MRAAAHVAALVLVPTALAAQYPVAPSPALDLRALPAELRFSGYISVRGTERRDTLAFTVNRARVGAQARPAPYMAVRVQADYAATGRTSADTVPAIILTDAYAQLVLRDSAAFGHLHPALVVGQFKTPFALEFLTSFALLQTVNRSQAVDRLAPRRDIGVLGQFVSTRRVLVQSAIVNGEGQNRAANIDGREMLMGRITVFPIARLAIAAKYLGQGGDHRWGYDARWIGRRATVEGEFLARRGPFSAGTTIDARGGYVLVSYKARPWLQPVFRWEELHDSRTSGTGTTSSRLDYTTVGLNVVPAGERIRFVVNYIFKSERPIPTGDEAVAQLIALF